MADALPGRQRLVWFIDQPVSDWAGNGRAGSWRGDRVAAGGYARQCVDGASCVGINDWLGGQQVHRLWQRDEIRRQLLPVLRHGAGPERDGVGDLDGFG